jgi:hypothetical protein
VPGHFQQAARNHRVGMSSGQPRARSGWASAGRRWGCVGAMVCWGWWGVASDTTIRLELPLPKPWSDRKYDLEHDAALEQLITDVGALVRLFEQQRQTWMAQRADLLASTPLEEMSLAQLMDYHHPPEEHLVKREERGLKHLRRLGREALASTTEVERERIVTLMREVSSAINNNRRPPAPRNLDGIQIPFVLIDHAFNPVAKGKRPASNLEPDAEGAEDADLSRRNPRASTFWRPPGDVASLDLQRGFGRVKLPAVTERVWEYAGPKTSYGGNPGYEVQNGNVEVKVKFGETHSEPFTARIFWALGYHADPTDYANGLRVRYDRRVLREFHVRRELNTTFRLFWFIPLHTMRLQKRHDPFDYIASAVMKDGRVLSAAELRRELFLDSMRKHPEDDPANFRAEVESQIDYLVTVAANIQVKDDRVEPIGPWDFGQLDHDERRELRGAGLLAAWLGWYDSRFENTRLKLVEIEGRKELRHYFSDLGGTLGRGKGFFSGRGELPEEFEWTFTRSRFSRKAPGLPRSFRITGFKPIEDTAAFKEMTIDDARWMARYIAQLTERQLTEALEVSGFEPDHVALYVRKLISRRDRMIEDLGLAKEIPPLHSGG